MSGPFKSTVFNSPQFAIWYLKARGCLLKERPASDVPPSLKPILTFNSAKRSKAEYDAMTYLETKDYRLKLESEFSPSTPAPW